MSEAAATELFSKSVVIKKFGSYDAISIEQFKLPPIEGHIEVKVEYGSLNFADLYTRQGLMQDKKFPFVLGMECVGLVTALGVEDTSFKVGQKVICYDYKGGMYREIVRVPPSNCYPVPDDVTMEDAAAIFVNYLTAYFAVLDLGNLRENQSVLLLSCAGGVGWAATQLARTVEGVKVYGTASSGKETEAQSNGVERVFEIEQLLTEAKTACPDGFDLIVTNHSDKILDGLLKMLKPLGRTIIIGANQIIQNDKKISFLSFMKLWMCSVKNAPLESLVVNNQAIGGLHLGTLIEKDPKKIRDTLEKIFKLLYDRKIKPKVHSVHPMTKIVEATKLLAERKNVGKVLITMKESE